MAHYGMIRRRGRLTLRNFMHVFSPGARAHILIVTKKSLGRAAFCDCGTPWTILLPFFATLIIHCKFQPLVFNTS